MQILFFFLFSHICIICTSVSDVATRTATAGTGAAPAGSAGTNRFQPSGTDRNSSGGGNSTAGAIGAGGAHYYLSGGKKIAVQTTGVIHKTIKIPKKVPKNGKLLFFVLCNMALIFFCIKIFNKKILMQPKKKIKTKAYHFWAPSLVSLSFYVSHR